MVGENAFSVASKGPCLFLMAQFQTYAVFSYLLYVNDDNVTNCIMTNVKKSMVHSFYSNLSFQLTQHNRKCCAAK